MRPIVQTVSGVGNGDPIYLNFNNVSIGMGFACVVTGTVNYTVQHTYDGTEIGSKTWWNHAVAALVNATTSQESNFVIPIAACRIVINSGAGSVTTTLLQQGI